RSDRMNGAPWRGRLRLRDLLAGGRGHKRGYGDDGKPDELHPSDVNTGESGPVVRFMEDLALDLRYAARSLARSRAVSAVAILTLALGIGATTTMFRVADAALLRPVPFADPDSLAILYVTRTTPGEGMVRLRWSRPVIARLEASLAASGPGA